MLWMCVALTLIASDPPTPTSAPTPAPTPAPTAPPTSASAAPPSVRDDAENGPRAILEPRSRTDAWWVHRHESFNRRAREGAERGDIDLIFLGDSITQGWEGAGKAVWEKHFVPRRAVNFGIGADRTQHVLYRIRNGNLDALAAPRSGAAPRLLVLLIGTNNTSGNDEVQAEEPATIDAGVRLIVREVRQRLPSTHILVLAVFPRGVSADSPRPLTRPQQESVRKLNERLSTIATDAAAAGDHNVSFLDISSHLLEPDGSISKAVMPDALHLSEEGYERWASAILPDIDRILTPDPHAPAAPR